jgi:capsule polysaccharide modification protein KpsS
MEWSYENRINVIFKNHPINPQSLEDVRLFAKRMDNCHFIDHDVNIHSLFKQAKAVYVINSGSAKEAMLHDVPIVRFGRADYNFAVVEGEIKDLDRTWQKVKNQSNETMKENYRTFYNWFINRICYDSTNIGSFLKLR